MPISEARRRANEKYNAKAYEDLRVRVPKDRKAVIQAASVAVGESLNGYVSKAIDERITRQEATSGATEGVSVEGEDATQ